MLAAPDPPLGDGVVRLRPFEERDLGSIERALRDPEIVRWFGESTLTASEFLTKKQNGWREGTSASFAICDRPNACVGQVFVELRKADVADLGYWLLPEGRHLGYATRGVRLVSTWALMTLLVARVQLWTEPENIASQEVAERSGFVREGVLRSFGVRRDGRRFDAVFYSLLTSDVTN